jgi:pimeloyl-ACP methyl ester carboxylesterase
VRLFLRRLETIKSRIDAVIAERFPGALVSKPDPGKPIATEWYLMNKNPGDQRLFVFLPGRRDRACDFVRRGFVALAQSRVPYLDCVAVDATIGYYLDGSLADRVQREVIEPAHGRGYREIWIVGVSMGGLGAFFHERAYPGQVTGLILLAPFVGDDRRLFAEIDEAGGALLWASTLPAAAAQKSKKDYQRELWRFLGGLQNRALSQFQIWIACGDGDRLLPGIERLKSIIPEERLIRLSGGHTWEVWTAGFSKILAEIDWNQ